MTDVHDDEESSGDLRVPDEQQTPRTLPSREHAVAHESGHAILLMSCASKDLTLRSVSVKPNRKRAGGMRHPVRLP